MQAIDLNELERLKRVHYETVISASETGGLSVVETADLSVRLNSRLLSELERILRAQQPKHRERYVPHPAARQQSLPFVAAPGSLS